MKTTVSRQVGLLVSGAAAAYFLDSSNGRQRRTLLRDSVQSGLRDFREFIDVGFRDLRNRTLGIASQARYRIKGRDVSDDVLVRRVASKMGRHVSHPHSIGVTADNGVVSVIGPVLAQEHRSLIRGIASVPGVRSVNDQLIEHAAETNVPGLQGGRSLRPMGSSEMGRLAMTPARRLVLGGLGTYLTIRGITKHGLIGGGLGILGLYVIGRCVSDFENRRSFGTPEIGRGISFQKTQTIHAPVDQVFAFFENFTNFPSFMRNVRQVQDLGGGTSRWVVAGPAGISVSWVASITDYEENALLAWRSEDGAAIANAGIIRFEPMDEQTTRVTLRMSYHPPAGALGHAVASLFGANPQRELDEDLARTKTFLETGRPARDAAARKQRMSLRTKLSGQEHAQVH